MNVSQTNNPKGSPFLSSPLEYVWDDANGTLGNSEYWRVNEAVLRQTFNAVYSELSRLRSEVDELKKKVKNV